MLKYAIWQCAWLWPITQKVKMFTRSSNCKIISQRNCKWTFWSVTHKVNKQYIFCQPLVWKYKMYETRPYWKSICPTTISMSRFGSKYTYHQLLLSFHFRILDIVWSEMKVKMSDKTDIQFLDLMNYEFNKLMKLLELKK